MGRGTLLTWVAPVLTGAARVALGLLWLNEGLIKYRAGFGSADILLVADSASTNSRVPEFFALFAENVLGRFPEFFGSMMPLLEVGLGVALVLGVLTLPAAVASVGLLMTYWLADQLTDAYPVMVVLAALLLLWPLAARRISVTALVTRRLPASGRARPLLAGLGRWT